MTRTVLAFSILGLCLSSAACKNECDKLAPALKKCVKQFEKTSEESLAENCKNKSDDEGVKTWLTCHEKAGDDCEALNKCIFEKIAASIPGKPDAPATEEKMTDAPVKPPEPKTFKGERYTGKGVGINAKDACASKEPCERAGLCTTKGEECVAGSDADCRQSRECEYYGQCTQKNGGCDAIGDDCKHSTRSCGMRGRCSVVQPICNATSDADCQRSLDCRREGHCAAKSGVCVAGADKHCADSWQCKERGLCALDPANSPTGKSKANGVCVAKTDAHCKASIRCKEFKRCIAKDGECARK